MGELHIGALTLSRGDSAGVTLIGIAGGSGSGKSAIARRVVGLIGGCIVDIDAYYLDRGELSAEQRAGLNYDEPDAIDVTLLIDHLTQLSRGESVDGPVYSFATHTRVGTAPISAGEIVIVEGLFALWWPDLRALLDLGVFIDAQSDLRFIRRLNRDVMQRRRTVDHVVQQYLNTVRPMHERYVESTRSHAGVVVSNDDCSLDACVGTIIAAIGNVIADKHDRKHIVRQPGDHPCNIALDTPRGARSW